MDESGTTQTALERPPPGPPPGLNASDEWPRPRRRWGRLIALVLVALLIVGGGGFAAVRFFAPASDDAIELVPRDSWFYASVFLDPSTSQKRALRDLLKQFPDGTPDEAADRIAKLLDEIFGSEGLSFTKDIEPWLGNQIAVFLRGGVEELDGAVLAVTENGDATQEFIEKTNRTAPGTEESRSYKGIDYHVRDDETAYGIIEGFYVEGSERGLKDVVDVTEGARESLAGSRRFANATARLEDDRLALAYLDTPILARVLVEEGVIPSGFATTSLVTSLSRPAVAVLYARADSVVLEGSIVVRDAPTRSLLAADEGRLLADLPGGAWFAETYDDLGDDAAVLLDAFGEAGLPVGLVTTQIERETGLDLRDDILRWVEDAGIFWSGSDVSTMSFGIVVETSDTRASARAVTSLASLLIRQGVPVRDVTNRSFAIQDPGMTERLDVIASDEQVVAAFGEGAAFAALGEGPRLRDNPIFRRASANLGEGFEPGYFMDAQGLIDWIERMPGVASGVYEREVRPHLEPLSYVVSGSRIDGETAMWRMVIGVE